ncbi:MAG TPA: hypothetical protein VHD76_11900 [Bryobacteraceae bacterium]|jgi:hypothetical protein|nr:hypothetical protein [Bryobacteraceae bacterium]
MKRLRAALSLIPPAIFLASCSSRPATSAHVDGVFEAYVPADAVFLAGADIGKIRQTKMFRIMVDGEANSGLSSFSAVTGLDPRKDLASFISWSDGEKAVTLARGNFNESQFALRLNGRGLRHVTYKGANLYANGSDSVVLLDSSLVAAGRTASIHSMLDRYDPARRLPLALAAQLKNVPENSEVWAVFIGGFDHLGAGLPSGNLAGVMQSLGGISSGSVGLEVTRGLDLQARLNCQSSDAAHRVDQAARGFLALGRLATAGKQPDLGQVFDAIQIRQDQTIVNVTASLPEDQAARFLDIWMKKGS